MTVAELDERMTVAEFYLWIAHDELTAWERDNDQTVASLKDDVRRG